MMVPGRRDLNVSLIAQNDPPGTQAEAYRRLNDQVTVLTANVVEMQRVQLEMQRTQQQLLTHITNQTAIQPGIPEPEVQGEQIENEIIMRIKPPKFQTYKSLYKYWLEGGSGIKPMKEWTPRDYENDDNTRKNYSKWKKVCKVIDACPGNTPVDKLEEFIDMCKEHIPPEKDLSKHMYLNLVLPRLPESEAMAVDPNDGVDDPNDGVDGMNDYEGDERDDEPFIDRSIYRNEERMLENMQEMQM